MRRTNERPVNQYWHICEALHHNINSALGAQVFVCSLLGMCFTANQTCVQEKEQTRTVKRLLDINNNSKHTRGSSPLHIKTVVLFYNLYGRSFTRIDFTLRVFTTERHFGLLLKVHAIFPLKVIFGTTFNFCFGHIFLPLTYLKILKNLTINARKFHSNQLFMLFSSTQKKNSSESFGKFTLQTCVDEADTRKSF